MAIDGWLMEQRAPAFRLYRWERPTLSLGFHQRSLEPHWGELAAAGVIDLVRRPSGGRAVLHAGDITYSMVWPEAVADRKRAYALACGWLLEVFSRIGLPLEPGRQAASNQRSSCFATSTPADLVHGCGAKRIGSAQLWRGGCLLQHGSILVEPPAALWRQVFGSDTPRLPRLPLGTHELEDLLTQTALALLPTAAGGIDQRPLKREELAAIEAGVPDYRVASALMESVLVESAAASPTSPEASMERTT
jgi:lipoate-protein ligase A